MKKYFLLTICTVLFLLYPGFAYYSTNFSQSSNTTGWGAVWNSGSNRGTITLGWGAGGYSGEDCLYIIVNKTSSASDAINLSYSNPSFVLGTDTIWSIYAVSSTTAQPPYMYTQAFSQQGSGYAWSNPGYDTPGYSGPTPSGFTGDISTTWQQFTLYRNDTVFGTPMIAIGIQFIIGTPTGTFVFKVDNAEFGPSLTPSPVVITTSTTLRNGVINFPYNLSLQANGGVSPYSWSTVSGTVPPGLSLINTGLISGTPNTLGTYNFTVQVTDSVSSSTTQALSLTITTSTFTVVQQRGMSYAAWGYNDLETLDSNSTIQVMASDSIQWVSLCDFWFQNNETDTVISASSTPFKYGASTTSIKYAFDQIHALGMKVLLKPMVDLCNGDWRGNIVPSNAWFSSYSSFIQFWAQLATEKNVDMLCIGCEFENTDSWDSSWRMIAATARANYSGPITYAVNWDHYAVPTWWDALDYMGIDAYFPLGSSLTPSLSDLSSAWVTTANDIASFRDANFPAIPVIFTEIGYQSADSANITPWETSSPNVNPTLQQNCYLACLSVMTTEPWFYGAYWWAWNTDPTSGGFSDTGFSPQNKYAENILKSFYSNTLTITGDTTDLPYTLAVSGTDTNTNNGYGSSAYSHRVYGYDDPSTLWVFVEGTLQSGDELWILIDSDANNTTGFNGQPPVGTFGETNALNEFTQIANGGWDSLVTIATNSASSPAIFYGNFIAYGAATSGSVTSETYLGQVTFPSSVATFPWGSISMTQRGNPGVIWYAYNDYGAGGQGVEVGIPKNWLLNAKSASQYRLAILDGSGSGTPRNWSNSMIPPVSSGSNLGTTPGSAMTGLTAPVFKYQNNALVPVLDWEIYGDTLQK